MKFEPTWPVLPVSKIVGFIWSNTEVKIPAGHLRGEDSPHLFAKAPDPRFPGDFESRIIP